MDWPLILNAGAGVAGAVFGGLAAFMTSRRKDRRDDYGQLFDRQQQIITDLQHKVHELDGELKLLREQHARALAVLHAEHIACREENARLKSRVAALETEVMELRSRGGFFDGGQR